MRHEVISRIRILSLGFLIAIIVIFALAWGHRVTLAAKEPVATVVEKAESAQDVNADSSWHPGTSTRYSDCVPMGVIGQSPEAYQIDEWYRSWGAPPNFSATLSDRPYDHFQKNDLKRLSANGDAEATHELGRSLIWSAFRSEDRMPDYQTLWEIGGDKFPYDDTLDMTDLELGRNYMYQAAIEGKIYALVEISLSYAHEIAILKKQQILDIELENSLRLEAYAYGESVENLIAGMPRSFFQSEIPHGQEQRAAEKLASLIARFNIDRADAGVDDASLPNFSDDLFNALNICSE